MTLTTVVGASGSGKTTFLNDVYKRHKCIYVRQYHSMRPFIVVRKIPNFDPTQLPFWDIYVNEKVDHKIKTGGTLSGKFTAGLSGGQRKLLLFELIFQRTKDQSDLLIVFDEPYSGVTDDFVPFIRQRLQEMSKRLNILLVTNDHIDTLKELSDNVITVSAIDRTKVKINKQDQVDREKALMALALGHKFIFNSTGEDFKFFIDTEILSSGQLLQSFIFAIVVFSLYTATFWDSAPSSAALVLISCSILTYFQINPYLLGLVDWRNCMLEEAEALVHSSAKMNRNLKIALTLSLMVILTGVQYAIVNVVTSGMFREAKYWLAMLCDIASLTLPLCCLGLFTRLPFQTVQLVGMLPFLLMVFFSTTFSPGAGVRGLKDLRYVFPRFYFWCMVPEIEGRMEGCPANNIILLYLVLSAFTGIGCVFGILGLNRLVRSCRKKQENKKRASLWLESRPLQIELYGEKAVQRLREDYDGSDEDEKDAKEQAGSGEETTTRRSRDSSESVKDESPARVADNV